MQLSNDTLDIYFIFHVILIVGAYFLVIRPIVKALVDWLNRH